MTLTTVDVLFFIHAVMAVLSGWRVFQTDSMVRASFFLLISFLAVGVIMLLLGAVYLGISLFFMMAVEMMIMALFMVMFMMNPAGLNPMKMVHQEKVTILVGVLGFVALGITAFFADFPSRPLPVNLEPVKTLGTELLGDSMLVFESAGVTLLATMIGVVALTSHKGRFGEANEGSKPPGLSPGGEPADAPAENNEDGEDHQGHHSH